MNLIRIDFHERQCNHYTYTLYYTTSMHAAASVIINSRTDTTDIFFFFIFLLIAKFCHGPERERRRLFYVVEKRRVKQLAICYVYTSGRGLLLRRDFRHDRVTAC